jgi:hypothetical protein
MEVKMSLIANVADRLLAAVVPRGTAAAWSCPAGCGRKTCYCGYGQPSGYPKGYYWFDECVSTVGGYSCQSCRITVWTC